MIKENIKSPCHWPLWWESTFDRWIPLRSGFPSQRASTAEYVSIWWRHHECKDCLSRSGDFHNKWNGKSHTGRMASFYWPSGLCNTVALHERQDVSNHRQPKWCCISLFRITTTTTTIKALPYWPFMRTIHLWPSDHLNIMKSRSPITICYPISVA